MPGVDLPQPLSPTRPERLALGDREADLVDRVHLARRATNDTAAHAGNAWCSAVTSSSGAPAQRSCRRLGEHSLRFPAGGAMAGHLFLERRHIRCRQRVGRIGAARRERAARRSARERRHHAGDLGEARRRVARARSAEPRNRIQQPARVGMARPANKSATGASSTLRPAYITTTRCAISATTPRSCVISTIAAPVSLLQLAHQVEDLRLDRDVERGGRLVGDQQLRARRRAPSRSSRAAACRPRAGAGTARRGAPAPGCAPGAASRPRAASRRRATSPRCSTSALGDLAADRQHRVERGHRLLEDHRDLVAAHLAHLRLGEREQVAAVEQIRARRPMRPGGEAIRRRIESEVTLLPQPRLADDRERLAAR